MAIVQENKQNTSLIETMFKAGAHFGYTRTKRHPTFEPFLFGSKEKVDIIDLEKTGVHLKNALDYAKELGQKNKNILFVSTKPEGRRVLEDTVAQKNIMYVSNRWIGGTLTNLPEIRKRVSRLEELQSKKEKGDLEVYTKKEKLLFDREMADLTRKFGGIVSMKQLPDALFIVDPKHEHTAFQEGLNKNIPIIALLSTDCSVKDIVYPIPANDSSVGSIHFFVTKMIDSYEEGRKSRETTKEEVVDSK